MTFCVTETAHRVGAKLCLVFLNVAHEEGVENHTQWRTPFVSSFFYLCV